MKKWMLCMCAVLSFTASWAQNEVRGTIVDRDTREVLPMASVKVNNTFIGSYSGTNGQFSLKGLKAGTYDLIVSYLGYATDTVRVTVPQAQTLEILLKKDAILIAGFEMKGVRASENQPITQTTISGKTLEKTNLGQDLPMLLDQTPSVVVNSDAGAGVGYTGLRIRGTDATRINVTFNGLPVNDAESQGVFWVNTPDITSSTSSLQIQRGVGTSSNGAGAFGATINLQTDELQAQPFASISSSAGFFNTFKNTIEVGTGLLGGHFAFHGRLSKITSDGFIDRSWSDLKSFFVSGGYYGKKSTLKFNIFSGKEATYQAWNGVPEYLLDTLPRFNSAGTDGGQLSTPYANETDNYQQDYYQLFYNQEIGKYIQLNTAAFYTRGKGYYEQYKVDETLSDYGISPVVTGADTVNQSDLIRQLWLDNHFMGGIFSLTYARKKWNVMLGGGGNHYIGDHYGHVIWAQFAGNSKPKDNYYFNDAHKTDINVYTKGEVTVAQKVTLFADIQYRYVNYYISGFRDNPTLSVHDQFHFVNPKLGVSYRINNQNKLYVYYGIANKEPNRVDYETGANTKPLHETLRDLEFGYQRNTRIYTVSVNGFWMDYSNQLIQTGALNDVGAYTRTNAPSSYRVGIEAEATVTFLKKLRLAANFTFSKNKINRFIEFIDDYDNGGQIAIDRGTTDISFSPDWIAGYTLSYLPVKGLELDFVGKYVGHQFLDNSSERNRRLSDFMVNHFRVRYNVTFGNHFELGLNLMLNNLFNVMYVPNGYSFSYVFGGENVTENFYYPQAGFHLMGGVTLKFTGKTARND